MSTTPQQFYSTPTDVTGEARKVVPRIRPENAPYFEGCREGRLQMQRCTRCSEFRFYPTPLCPFCRSPKFAWDEVRREGVVYSFSIVHRPAPGFEEDGQYVYALVELADGPVMPTNIVGVPAEDVYVGQPVRAEFVAVNDDVSIPVFTPSEVAA